MNARATRRGVPAGVIWGALGVLLWSAFAIFNSGAAQADESDDSPLHGLTSLVGQTVTAVAEPAVTPVVTEVVAPVVRTVVAPAQQTVPAVVKTVTQTVSTVPVVAPVAGPVVKTVADTTQAVIAPLTDLLTDSPVAQITDPILGVVTGLPVVGNIVDDLGVTDVVREVVGVVDDTTGLVGGVTAETLPPVLESLDPTLPGTGTAPGVPGIPGVPNVPAFPNVPGTPATTDDIIPVTVLAAAGAPAVDAAASALSSTFSAPASMRPASGPPPVSAGVHAAPDPAGPLAPGAQDAPPGTPVSPTSSAGPGGAPSYAQARINEPESPPLRAWERASGASDDALPASPVADTDVSPD